jgi:hypothetical protein
LPVNGCGAQGWLRESPPVEPAHPTASAATAAAAKVKFFENPEKG